MKKLITLFLMLCFFPVYTYALKEAISVEETNIQDAEVIGVFQLKHSVERESYFKTIISKSLIDKAGKTEIGRFIVRNNTKDGFAVKIESEFKGNLQPSTTDDGETDIPYSIELQKDGEIGEGLNYVETFTSTALANEQSILEMAGDAASSPTDAEFKLVIDIKDDSNVMGMAGTYQDSLTLTYEDL